MASWHRLVAGVVALETELRTVSLADAARARTALSENEEKTSLPFRDAN